MAINPIPPSGGHNPRFRPSHPLRGQSKGPERGHLPMALQAVQYRLHGARTLLIRQMIQLARDLGELQSHADNPAAPRYLRTSFVQLGENAPQVVRWSHHLQTRIRAHLNRSFLNKEQYLDLDATVSVLFLVVTAQLLYCTANKRPIGQTFPYSEAMNLRRLVDEFHRSIEQQVIPEIQERMGETAVLLQNACIMNSEVYEGSNLNPNLVFNVPAFDMAHALVKPHEQKVFNYRDRAQTKKRAEAIGRFILQFLKPPVWNEAGVLGNWAYERAKDDPLRQPAERWKTLYERYVYKMLDLFAGMIRANSPHLNGIDAGHIDHLREPLCIETESGVKTWSLLACINLDRAVAGQLYERQVMILRQLFTKPALWNHLLDDGEPLGLMLGVYAMSCFIHERSGRTFLGHVTPSLPHQLIMAMDAREHFSAYLKQLPYTKKQLLFDRWYRIAHKQGVFKNQPADRAVKLARRILGLTAMHELPLELPDNT